MKLIPKFTASLIAGAMVIGLCATESTAFDLYSFNKGLTSSNGNVDPRAPEGGARVVVFGDSQTAGTNLPLTADERGCTHSVHSWPANMGASLGLGMGDLIDTSCSGASLNSGSGFWFSDLVRRAQALGGLGPRTEDILVQLGFNDFWGPENLMYVGALQNCLFDARNGCEDRAVAAGTVFNPNVITADYYVDRIEPVITYLRYYYPQAKISFVGYPELVSVPGELCVRILGLPVRKAKSMAMTESFTRISTAQREAAARLGVGYVDIPALTAGHGPCGANPWVNGLLTAPDVFSGPLHLSTEGERIVGAAVADYVRMN